MVTLSVIAFAQRTVVEKNGVGGRIETDYNAAGKVTEMRTVGCQTAAFNRNPITNMFAAITGPSKPTPHIGPEARPRRL